MWFFGYGSLLWDSWERGLDCLRRVPAELPGQIRSFSKASVRNWGTSRNPGPTLNLVPHETASCKGIAFEFPEARRDAVLAYLAGREGKDFRFDEHRILLEGGEPAMAIVPAYSGRNVIADQSVERRAKMVLEARGTDGDCYAYVENIANKLAELNIDDPAVTEFWQAVRSEKETGS